MEFICKESVFAKHTLIFYIVSYSKTKMQYSTVELIKVSFLFLLAKVKHKNKRNKQTTQHFNNVFHFFSKIILIFQAPC